jgi:hypothetical protein
MLEAAASSETSIPFCHVTRGYNPKTAACIVSAMIIPKRTECCLFWISFRAYAGTLESHDVTCSASYHWTCWSSVCMFHSLQEPAENVVPQLALNGTEAVCNCGCVCTHRVPGEEYKNLGILVWNKGRRLLFKSLLPKRCSLQINWRVLSFLADRLLIYAAVSLCHSC